MTNPPPSEDDGLLVNRRPTSAHAAFVRATLLGTEIALSVLLPTVAGNWADGAWGVRPWGVLAGLAVGSAVAALAVGREVRRLTKEDEEG